MQQAKTQKPSWALLYSKDENGKEMLIMEGRTPVVMEWEKPYLNACVGAVNPKGDVLEVGFGLGFAAEEIQKFNPKSLTIIEDLVPMLPRAKEWAKQKKGVKIIENGWESSLNNMGYFDAIIFDDHVRLTDEDIPALEKASSKIQTMQKDIGVIKKDIEEILARSKGQKFNDTDLIEFEKHVMKIKPDMKMVEDFLNRLVKDKSITDKQKDIFLQKCKKNSPKESQVISMNSFIDFAELCLNKHMKKGSKMSAFVTDPDFKNTNKEFQKRILSRSDVSYSEKMMPINVPENCKYYSGNKAMVMVIEKK